MVVRQQMQRVLGEADQRAFAVHPGSLVPKRRRQREALAGQPLEIGVVLIDQRLDRQRVTRVIARFLLRRNRLRSRRDQQRR